MDEQYHLADLYAIGLIKNYDWVGGAYRVVLLTDVVIELPMEEVAAFALGAFYASQHAHTLSSDKQRLVARALASLT